MVKARKRPAYKAKGGKILVPTLIGLIFAFIMPVKAIWIILPVIIILAVYYRSKWTKVWKCPKCGYHYERLD